MKEAISSDTPGSVEAAAVRHFRDFAIAPDVLVALTQMGIDVPTPIQDACIPSILEGKDVVGKADTGTGKTIGFGAPLVGRIDTNRVAVQALVLTPTRELAQQVAGVLELLGAGRGLGVALVVGGVHASEQVLKLRSGSQVVVGTPGRVLDFLRERTMSLVWCETVVLDEADRMLDMGFIDDVTAILDNTPKERQTLLFSATIPPEISRILKRYMRAPEHFSTSKGLSTVSDIRQSGVECEVRHKFRTLQQILQSQKDSTVLIFCNTRRQAIDLDRMLWGHGYSAGALHGDQEQDVRFKILEAFRGGSIRILVATDVASRGLDIEDIACVVNYEIPNEPESYVHRIGRTGRAQRTGEAISIVAGSKELGAWKRILKQTGFKVARLTSGHLQPRGAQEAVTSSNGGSRDASLEARRGEATGRTPNRGEPTVAPENDHLQPTPGPGGQASAARNIDPKPEAGNPQRAAGGPAGENDERRRPRRRRRRGGGGGGGGGGGREGGVSQERGARPASGGDRSPRPSPPPRRLDDGYVDADAPTPEETSAWLRTRAKAETPKPERLRLEDVDDDYLKTDYFEVDHALVERAGPSPLPRPTRERGERPEAPAAGGGPASSQPSGRRSDRSGRGAPRPDGRERPRGQEGRGGPPAPGAAAPRGDQPRADDGDGRRRRRRRRGRGGRGGGGGGGGGGNGGGGGGGPPA